MSIGGVMCFLPYIHAAYTLPGIKQLPTAPLTDTVVQSSAPAKRSQQMITNELHKLFYTYSAN
jgi:hypothetical protein